jgi:hypothetical protein
MTALFHQFYVFVQGAGYFFKQNIKIQIQWRYSPTGLWPTERPPPVSEASANFCG